MPISVPSPGGLTLPQTHSYSAQLSRVPIPRISASHSEGEIATLGSKENPAKTNPELATQTQTTQSLKCCHPQKARSTNSLFGSSFPGEQTKAGRSRNAWKSPPGVFPPLAGRPVPSSRSGAQPGDGRGDSTATGGELHINLPGRNLFPGWPSLEMTGGTSSTLSQGVRAAAGLRFLPRARQELPRSFPVCLRLPQTGK